jgi:hypothetical protein
MLGELEVMAAYISPYGNPFLMAGSLWRRN